MDSVNTIDEFRSTFGFSDRHHKASVYKMKKPKTRPSRAKEKAIRIDEARKLEMQRLRDQENWSIGKIGKHYGLSRQRIAQIIGKVGRRKDVLRLPRSGNESLEKTKIAIKSFPTSATNQDIADALKISVPKVVKHREQKRHASKSLNSEKGTRIEEIVSTRLTEMGIKNTLMPSHHSYDIELSSGKRIEVKSRFVQNWSGTSMIHSFTLVKNANKDKLKTKADFYILVIGTTLEMFVVPSACLTEKQTTVGFTWPKPTNHGRPSRISCYFERFDLLT